MIADDTSTYASHVNLHKLVDGINKDLFIISDWFKANNETHSQKHASCYLPKLSILELNCILIIQKSKRKSTKFLGVIIDNQLT